MVELRLGDVGHDTTILSSVMPAKAGIQPRTTSEYLLDRPLSRTMTTVGSRHHLAERGHFESFQIVGDLARDESRGDRSAVVVQDRDQPHRVDAEFIDD